MPGKKDREEEAGGFSVVAVTAFGKLRVARYATRELAEHRATELNAWAERNPRGYVHYLVQPVRLSEDWKEPPA